MKCQRSQADSTPKGSDGVQGFIAVGACPACATRALYVDRAVRPPAPSADRSPRARIPSAPGYGRQGRACPAPHQTPLIAAGATTGTLDDDGYVREEGNAAQVVRDAIDALFPEAWGAEEGRRIIAAVLRAKTDDISDV